MADRTDAATAAALDAADPLARFRERFLFADPDLVYLDGNSLGRLPHATRDRLARLVEREWGGDLIRGWPRWMALPASVGDLIGTELLGALPGETLVADSTTVNFYRLAAGALDARPGRRTIVTDRDNFPTDRYVLEGLAAARGLTIHWLEGDPVDGPTVADVRAALAAVEAERPGDVALVTLTHVNYRSAAIADLAGITAAAHEAGALALWDLSHSAGAVEVGLEAAGVDLAVGCTYKYLNGGPGAPAFLYVRRALHELVRNPIQGWFGQANLFEMGQGYRPQPGIAGWQVGTPGVLALAAVEEGVRLVAEAGIGAVREKGIALTTYAVELHDAWLAPLGCSLGSPREAGRRGNHVSVRVAGARELTNRLVGAGIVPDFRTPDSIRFGMSPLTTSFGEVRRAFATLRELLGG